MEGEGRSDGGGFRLVELSSGPLVVGWFTVQYQKPSVGFKKKLGGAAARFYQGLGTPMESSSTKVDQFVESLMEYAPTVSVTWQIKGINICIQYLHLVECRGRPLTGFSASGAG